VFDEWPGERFTRRARRPSCGPALLGMTGYSASFNAIDRKSDGSAASLGLNGFGALGPACDPIVLCVVSALARTPANHCGGTRD